MKWAGLSMVLALLSSACAAQAYDHDKVCQGPLDFDSDTNQIRLMRVVAPERVHFIEGNLAGKAQCPDLSAACRRKGFVLKDDVVLTLPPEGTLVCASFIAPRPKRVNGQFSESSGFLPAASVQAEAIPAPTSADWTGTWYRNAEAEISIKPGQGGKMVIEGAATYGAFDSYRVKNGAVNEGSLEGEAVPKGNMIAIGERYDGTKPFAKDSYECQARLVLLGRYLVVQDSGFCGGANVRFTGIYVKLKP